MSYSLRASLTETARSAYDWYRLDVVCEQGAVHNVPILRMHVPIREQSLGLEAVLSWS